MYKSGTVDPMGASIIARIGLDNAGIVGVRLDKNSDNDFYEFYIVDNGSLGATWEFVHSVASSRSVVTGTINHPSSLFYVIRLLILQSGASPRGYLYLLNEIGGYGISFAYTSGEPQWGSTIIRAGIVNKSSTAAGVCDAFYNGFV